ncbi:MAG: sigma-54 dependent transcriptional regulator [Proteobacteria bacterium]|nr:sigma-54 dependent transcriptional regulator [Pseudomonadota bacterium]
MTKLLIVDDEQGIREMLEIYFKREGYDVTTASDGETALAYCKKTPFDVVVADIKMPRMDGINLLNRVKEFSPETIFIMITAFASFETAKESMKKEAYDYITKPFDVDEVKRKIDAALAKRNEELRISSDAGMAVNTIDSVPGASAFENLLGQSAEMKKVFDIIPRAALAKTNVLITGESGTGKELVAKAIHYHSPRRQNPFVTINCGGIPETLLESELFGYKKGAFTGAAVNKKGFFEVAHGGTIFLDEVGELPLSLQVKLLRVVQEKTFTPVGGTEEVKVDVRIISATNKNLEKKVIEGTFREDLYYRLNVIHIHISPLRERKEDIPLMANYFLKKYSHELGKDVTEISSYAMDCLSQYHFPGNVRELENIIEKGVALAKTSIMLPESLELSKFKSEEQEKTVPESRASVHIPPEGIQLDEVLEHYEKAYIEEALKMSKGSITGAARLLGISFRSMRYRLEKCKLDEHALKQ